MATADAIGAFLLTTSWPAPYRLIRERTGVGSTVSFVSMSFYNVTLHSTTMRFEIISLYCKMALTKMKNKKEISPSEAAGALGSIRTERKSASSTQNIKHAQDARKAKRLKLADVPCTCGKGWSLNRIEHAGTCKLYQAIYYRERKSLPLD
jgi:hypothetical protein